MTEKKSWTKDFWSGTYWADFPYVYEGDSDIDTQRLQELDEAEIELAEEDNDD